LNIDKLKQLKKLKIMTGVERLLKEYPTASAWLMIGQNIIDSCNADDVFCRRIKNFKDVELKNKRHRIAY
jgi:hypothetical protein